LERSFIDDKFIKNLFLNNSLPSLFYINCSANNIKEVVIKDVKNITFAIFDFNFKLENVEIENCENLKCFSFHIHHHMVFKSFKCSNLSKEFKLSLPFHFDVDNLKKKIPVEYQNIIKIEFFKEDIKNVLSVFK
jgi:hypothetical protein